MCHIDRLISPKMSQLAYNFNAVVHNIIVVVRFLHTAFHRLFDFVDNGGCGLWLWYIFRIFVCQYSDNL